MFQLSRLYCLPFLAAVTVFEAAGQSPEALSQFFEGKQVTMKLDMPGTQKGIEIYPDRPQPLDARSYASRMKDNVMSIRNGDTATITKIKVKSDNIEFQLGGGGYGTAGDETDASVHFKPAEKSSHEKELEDQLSKETDDDRRRSLSRELDDLRRDRERQDRRDRAAAEEDAAARTDRILAARRRGGSRFNIHFDKRMSSQALTPQVIMEDLAPYVGFPVETFGPNTSAPSAAARSESANPGQAQPPAALQTPAPPPAPTGDLSKSLKKGLTRAQVEALFGPPVETHDRTQDNLTITTCKYQSASETVQADFANGVLIQYTVSSR